MATSDKLALLSTTKANIKAALIAQGQSVSDNDAFSTYPAKIRAIVGGSTPQIKHLRRADADNVSGFISASSTLTGYTHTITITLNDFTSDRTLLYLYLQYGLSIAGSNASGAYSLILTPHNSAYGGYLTSGNAVWFIASNNATYTQGTDTLTIVVIWQGGTDHANYSAGNLYSSDDHYLYLEE